MNGIHQRRDNRPRPCFVKSAKTYLYLLLASVLVARTIGKWFLEHFKRYKRHSLMIYSLMMHRIFFLPQISGYQSCSVYDHVFYDFKEPAIVWDLWYIV